MKNTLMLIALAIVLTAPAFAGASDAAPQVVERAATQAPAIDVDAEIGAWLAAGSDRAMQESIAQAEIGETAGCTASTRCYDGSTISCSGNRCFTERNCFVYCDTTGAIYCNNLCP